MSEKTKIAVIGCGKQAPKHISGLRKLPGIELVLADQVPDYAAALGARENLPWVSEVDAVFADPEIKAIDICTPTKTHISLIRQAIASGKDFFCEKPLCDSLEEALEIQELMNRSGRIGMVGYVYRFSPVFELAHRIFEEVPTTGESLVLGRIVTAFFRLGGRGGHQIWKHKRETGGGAINEMLVHMVDLAIWFFGPVKEAKMLVCELQRPIRPINGKPETVDAEDNVWAWFKMTSGVEVICQADLLTPAFTQFVEVQGENGTFMGSIQADMPSFVFCNQPAAGYAAGKTAINFGHQNLFEAQMAEFVRAVRYRRSPNRCTVEDSVQLLRAMEMLRKGR